MGLDTAFASGPSIPVLPRYVGLRQVARAGGGSAEGAALAVPSAGPAGPARLPHGPSLECLPAAALAASAAVAPLAAAEGVSAPRSVELVLARPAQQRVAARAAKQPVPAVAAQQPVGAEVAAED